MYSENHVFTFFAPIFIFFLVFDTLLYNKQFLFKKNDVFFDFLSLTKVTFPETLHTIGKNSFRGCKKLEKIAGNPRKPLSCVRLER